MNLLTALVSNIRALTMEDPAQPLQPYSVMMDMLGMTTTDAGLLINEKTALRQTTVLACVRVISQGLASLPLVIYEREKHGKRKATDHRLYPMLHDEPNPQMSSMVLREGGEAQRQLWGNAYLEIQRDKALRAVSLWPLPSDKTNAERLNGQLVYVTTATPRGDKRYIDPKNMLHVPGLAFDGLMGISPIQLAKQAVGRVMAMERFGSQFFGNGVRPSGAFVYSGGSLTPEAKDNLRQTLQSAASGQNALRPLLLENGLEWKPMSIPPNEAQFIDAMKFGVSEICRIFGVQPHLVMDLERSTNNNIEQQSLEHVMYTLRPCAVRWEQELNRKLFAGTDFFAEHSMEGLLRGDFQTRMEGYAKLFGTGAISPNMIAELENWNQIPDGDGGNLHFVPLNLIPLEGVAKVLNDPNADPGGATDGTPDDPADAGAATDGTPNDPNAAVRRERVFASCRRIFRDAVGRTIARDVRDQETVRRIWEAPVETLACMVSLCAVGSPIITEDARELAGRYAAAVHVSAKGWKREEIDALTEGELANGYDAFAKLFGIEHDSAPKPAPEASLAVVEPPQASASEMALATSLGKLAEVLAKPAEPAVINLNPVINVEAAQPAQVTVNPPQVTVNPTVQVEAPKPVPESSRSITLERDDKGVVTGAKVTNAKVKKEKHGN